MKPLVKPPAKLSDLLELAINDLRKCKNDSRYGINMQVWHEPISAFGKCFVCLAGAVMAQTLGVSPNEHADPVLLPHFEKHLNAINCARTGLWSQALHYLDLYVHDPSFLFPNGISLKFGENNAEEIIGMLRSRGL